MAKKLISELVAGDWIGPTIEITTASDFPAGTYSGLETRLEIESNGESGTLIIDTEDVGVQDVTYWTVTFSLGVGFFSYTLCKADNIAPNTTYTITIPKNVKITNMASSGYYAGTRRNKATINYRSYSSMSLKNLCSEIISKINFFNSLINTLCTRFTTHRAVDGTTQTLSSGFSIETVGGISRYSRQLGPFYFFWFRSKKSSNWGTGNITNTTVVKISPHLNTVVGARETGVWAHPFMSGSSGGLKSGYAYHATNVPEPILFDVNAVDTADVYFDFYDWVFTQYDSIL